MDGLLLDARSHRWGLSLPAQARALVLVVHPHAASRCQPGWDFVADVLHAHGLVTLPLCRLTAAAEAAGAALPDPVQSKLAWPELFDWLARQPALGGRPLALIGLGEAARDCIAAAARFGGGRLKSLVLLDAAIGRARHPLERLSLPTLFVLGHADERRLAHCRAALRGMPAAHRLVVLPQPTLPRPAPGALEAFACSALEWLGRTLPHPTGDESRHASTLPADRRVAGWQPPAAAAGQR